MYSTCMHVVVTCTVHVCMWWLHVQYMYACAGHMYSTCMHVLVTHANRFYPVGGMGGASIPTK